MDSKFMVSLILLLSMAKATVALSSRDGFPAAAEAHWKTILPDTTMPVVINELLHPAKKGLTTSTIILPIIMLVTYGPKRSPHTVDENEKLSSLHKIPNATLFFFEDDLKRPGTRMHIRLAKRTTDSTSFLPSNKAKSIPFSTADLPNTLSRFSIKPKSKLALLMQETLRQCEAPALKSEVKQCTTSLESMVDFAVSELGTNKGVRAMATVLEDRKATGKKK